MVFMRNYLTYLRKVCLSLMLTIILLLPSTGLGPPAQSMPLPDVEITPGAMIPYDLNSIRSEEAQPVFVAEQAEKERDCPSGNFGTMCRIVRQASNSVFLIEVLEVPLPGPSIGEKHPETGTN